MTAAVALPRSFQKSGAKPMLAAAGATGKRCVRTTNEPPAKAPKTADGAPDAETASSASLGRTQTEPALQRRP